jgi:mRNA interferase RelE/StbE
MRWQHTILKYLNERVAQCDDPRQFGHALIAQFSGLWRYRVGDYRIVCEIQDRVLRILVVAVGHSSDIYR